MRGKKSSTREVRTTINRIQNGVLWAIAFCAITLMPTMSLAQSFSDLKTNGPLTLRGYGSFYLEGTPHPIDAADSRGGDPVRAGISGLSMINQMHVQYLWPDAKKKFYPIAMVHGCCLSSKSWQTTPDGRMGWDEYFARNGFDTYLVDQVSRGRSGFDATPYNRVRTGSLPVLQQPPAFISSDQHGWNVFRFGTTPCTASPCSATTTPHPDIRFPMNTVGVGPGSNLQFYNQIIPDLNGTLPGSPIGCTSSQCAPNDPSAFYNTPAQMAKLAKQLGGAVLVGHSESSTFPTRAAFQTESGCYPYTTEKACKVKGIIQLETGCFRNLTASQINTLSKIPILIMYGDYAGSDPRNSCQTEFNQITAVGGDIKFAWLPLLVKDDLYPGSPGPIRGNTHMMMFDNNNLKIADILIGWIDRHVKKPTKGRDDDDDDDHGHHH